MDYLLLSRSGVDGINNKVTNNVVITKYIENISNESSDISRWSVGRLCRVVIRRGGWGVVGSILSMSFFCCCFTNIGNGSEALVWSIVTLIVQPTKSCAACLSSMGMPLDAVFVSGRITVMEENILSFSSVTNCVWLSSREVIMRDKGGALVCCAWWDYYPCHHHSFCAYLLLQAR